MNRIRLAAPLGRVFHALIGEPLDGEALMALTPAERRIYLLMLIKRLDVYDPSTGFVSKNIAVAISAACQHLVDIRSVEQVVEELLDGSTVMEVGTGGFIIAPVAEVTSLLLVQTVYFEGGRVELGAESIRKPPNFECGCGCINSGKRTRCTRCNQSLS